MHITRDGNVVSWNYGSTVVSIELANVYYARYFQQKGYVILKTRRTVTDISYFYYGIDGTLFLEYHLETSIIKWLYNLEFLTLEVSDLKNVEVNQEKRLLYIIYGEGDKKFLKVIDLEGNEKLVAKSPAGFEMKYFSDIENNGIKVVCEATTEENIDSFGRYQFNFLLDLETGQWEKLGLAY
ncbi:hypothetical protein [Streptococcus sp. A22]|uniref:hypothetical protein n=1 Tax=Streptococcus sp. A22 TaxID=3373126 RepID=UPI001553AC82|nr:hypothetical protein [Streptococcus suis]NQK93762.1 hypothetical protein [Streptococcus suis]UUM62354.1 hypothetical protein NQZ89_01935 [Streptococcus suis]HEP1844079.1 hypothetical protein [Streptococcus suis]